MPNTEIIRAYQLQKGDTIIMTGRLYLVIKMTREIIWYSVVTPRVRGSVWHHKNTMSARSFERIERVIPETILNNNKHLKNGNQSKFRNQFEPCVNCIFNGFSFAR